MGKAVKINASESRKSNSEFQCSRRFAILQLIKFYKKSRVQVLGRTV